MSQSVAVRPSTNPWRLLASDGDGEPGDSDDDPGMDELMDELFPEERETVAAPSDPSRGPPVRPRRASVQGTEGTEEAGARVPADSRTS